MNLRNWNKQHTIGLLIGILAPLICIPLVVMILSSVQGYSFTRLWNTFEFNHQVQSKIVSLSIIANLGLFYVFLNKEKYNYAMGIILGSICFLPVILYLIFIA
ncbi:MAG: hypothetical protein KJ941_00615 [Bacteroidetes bacterium]|nr:hypothetical protein [Bacteroidota bacterium]